MTRSDWPLGPALKRAREHAGISVRAAARRTDGAISSGRWYQLESGYQKVGGQSLPIGTTASTVAAAAQAVDWDVEEALNIAGFDVRDFKTGPTDPLARYTDEELIAEIRHRMKGARRGVEGEAEPPASGEADEEQKMTLRDEAKERAAAAGRRMKAVGKGVGVQQAGDGE